MTQIERPDRDGRGRARLAPWTYRAEPRPRVGIFPSFFMAGFECSTFIWKDGTRRDYVVITGHDRELDQDYDRVQRLGMDVVREAVRWPIVDVGTGSGKPAYDWSTVAPLVEALERRNMRAIWDLCHYGFPDGCNPLEPGCLERFRDYCRAVAEYLVPLTRKPRFFTPVNEISFTAAATTDTGWFWPLAKGRYAQMKRALGQMAIEGVKAIRQVDPEARMVHVDPMIHAVPPRDRPDLSDEARHHAYEQAYEGWDMLAGRMHPELGGSPEILDIVGVNIYHFSQAQMNADGTREVMGPRDERRRPLSELLQFAWERYRRPIIIGETSGYQDKRGEWMRMVMEESLRALNAGIDLQGVCLYPCVDIPDWESGEWAKIGIFDLRDKERCERVPCDDYIEELRRWQRMLDVPEAFRPGERPGRVELEEVRRHAAAWGGRR